MHKGGWASGLIATRVLKLDPRWR